MQKVTNQRAMSTPFDIRDNRIMLSLGPLSSKKYCTFSCAFCYVQAEFASYASLTLDETLAWVRSVREPYDVIYVSGDTDSFARPRTEMGIGLLEGLAQFNVDLLFTTRHVFVGEDLAQLAALARRLRRSGRRLVGCTSICQLHHPHLEPKPVPLPSERLAQLGRFRRAGLTTVLALRPFMPTVPIVDYLTLAERAAGSVDAILGEMWFADSAGRLEARVFGAGPRPDAEMRRARMDFDENDAEWRVWAVPETERRVRERCVQLGIPFFMRSRPALEYFRAANRGIA
jgi:DNA repair photolyase